MLSIVSREQLALQPSTLRALRGKLLLPRPEKPKVLGWYGRLQEPIAEVSLFHLKNDIGETKNVAAKHPDVVQELLGYANTARKVLGDSDRRGDGWR